MIEKNIFDLATETLTALREEIGASRSGWYEIPYAPVPMGFEKALDSIIDRVFRGSGRVLRERGAASRLILNDAAPDEETVRLRIEEIRQFLSTGWKETRADGKPAHIKYFPREQPGTASMVVTAAGIVLGLQSERGMFTDAQYQPSEGNPFVQILGPLQLQEEILSQFNATPEPLQERPVPEAPQP